MDKVIKTSLGLFVVILVAFAGIITYTEYTETAYRNTITGTYTYTCTITTDAALSNVTFFIPVPADSSGNSLVVSSISSHAIAGVPTGWVTTLYDTGKSTMVRVTVPSVIPPEGTSASNPYTVTFSSETASRTAIDTRDPVGKIAMFRPVQALSAGACPQGRADGSSQCYTYTTSVYADYVTAADTTVTITSAVTGKNSWKIFEPRSNEYHTEVSTSMKGENHGWVVLSGELSSGTGTYDIPAGISSS